jgi:hypothetical protein
MDDALIDTAQLGLVLVLDVAKAFEVFVRF